MSQVLGVLCAAFEYDEMPVRHNEDKLNAALAQEVRLRVDPRSADDPHTKTNLLLQARSSGTAVSGAVFDAFTKACSTRLDFMSARGCIS